MSRTFAKTLKPLKKLKAAYDLPPPYINYLDSTNTEFLQHTDTHMIKASNQDILVVDHKSIAQAIEQDRDQPDLKDLAFFGRSNVGKSSLINTIAFNLLDRASNSPYTQC